MAKAWFSRNLLTSLQNQELQHQSTATLSTITDPEPPVLHKLLLLPSPVYSSTGGLASSTFITSFAPPTSTLLHGHLRAPIIPETPPQDHLHLSTIILLCHRIHLLTSNHHAPPSLISTFTSTKTLSCCLQCSTTATMATIRLQGVSGTTTAFTNTIFTITTTTASSLLLHCTQPAISLLLISVNM
ncbi:HTH myb-type domain-containing protein [Psidium guajava]|nr:HTH myb-type domain-containing protein [Psidium guajava]